MIKIFLDYKQELSALKNIQFMQMVNEVHLKFLLFLKENPEFIDRSKTNLTGVAQFVIDKYLDKKVDFIGKE